MFLQNWTTVARKSDTINSFLFWYICGFHCLIRFFIWIDISYLVFVLTFECSNDFFIPELMHKTLRIPAKCLEFMVVILQIILPANSRELTLYYCTHSYTGCDRFMLFIRVKAQRYIQKNLNPVRLKSIIITPRICIFKHTKLGT